MEIDWNKAIVARVGVRKREPKLIISKVGGVRLNPAFVRLNELKGKKYVKTRIFNMTTKVIIGFEFMNEKEEETLTVGFGKNDSAGFSGRAVLSQAGINFKNFKTTHFQPKKEKFGNNEIYFIELSI